jgi:hypothetical protein
MWAIFEAVTSNIALPHSAQTTFRLVVCLS